MEKFEFEFGISFLSKDESVAKKIYDELKQHASTYFYRDQERNQIFQNGVDLYSDIFQNKIRFAIILYREEWGKKGITSIEKLAIQQILIDEVRGVDHIFLITMDGKSPNWWGANIYEKYEQSKLNIIIGNILYMHKKIGGEIIETDPIQNFKILREKKKRKEEKVKFLNQVNGKVIELLKGEFENLIELFKIKLVELGNEVPHNLDYQPIIYNTMAHSYLTYNTQSDVNSEKFRIFVYLIRGKVYTAEGSLLYIYAGHQFDWYEHKVPPANRIFKFTVDDDLNPGWELIDDNQTFFNSKEVLNLLFKELQKYFESDVANTNKFVPGNYYIGGSNRGRINRL